MKILYFAWVRQKTGVAEEQVDLPDHVTTVADLIDWLRTRGPEFENAFENIAVVRAAVDQTHARLDTPVSENTTEVAFFPPVTGG